MVGVHTVTSTAIICTVVIVNVVVVVCPPAVDAIFADSTTGSSLCAAWVTKGE